MEPAIVFSDTGMLIWQKFALRNEAGEMTCVSRITMAVLTQRG